jgi:hypothetical protein
MQKVECLKFKQNKDPRIATCDTCGVHLENHPFKVICNNTSNDVLTISESAFRAMAKISRLKLEHNKISLSGTDEVLDCEFINTNGAIAVNIKRSDGNLEILKKLGVVKNAN